MLSKVVGGTGNSGLMGMYATSLGEAVLRHRTRQAEKAAEIESKLANKVKSEFISNMSHELRTPLNSVIGFAKLLVEHDKRKLKDQDVVEYARLIQDAAGHLLSVINDILDISKLQSGSLMLNPHEIDIDRALEDCIAAFVQIAAETNVDLKQRIPHELPPVLGDETKLRQVFSNVISNAVKFTHSGGTVEVSAADMQDGRIMVQVRDTGIGMTAEEIRVALAPFGQVDAGRTRWREGTGLGLPIAKSLVELHGGSIEIESIKSRGTTVTIILPTAEHAQLQQDIRDL